MVDRSAHNGNSEQKIKIAMSMVNHKKISEAIAVMETMRKEGNLTKKDLLKLGEIYLEIEDWNNSLSIFKEILLSDPNHSKAYNRMKKAFIAAGNQEGETEFLEAMLVHKQLKKRELRYDILMRLREIYENSENEICLLRILENMHRLDPGNKDLVFDLARSYIELDKKDEKAMEIYEKAYRMAHELPDLERHLVTTYRILKKDRWRNLDICLQYYRKNPEDVENISYLAEAFMKKDEAVDDSIEVIYLECLTRGLLEKGALLYHMGLFYERRKQYHEAIKYYKESNQEGFSQWNHYPLMKIALLSELLGDLDNAKKNILLHYKKFPDDNECVRNARRILLAQELRQNLSYEELKLARTLIEKDPSVRDFIFIGRSLIDKCKDFEEALRCFQSALKIDPGHIEVLEGLKDCLIAIGKFVEAAETLENILLKRLKQEKRIKHTLELVSIYSQKLKKYDKAILLLDEILLKDKTYYQAHLEKISIYKEIKDREKYYESLNEAWNWHISDVELLRKMREYFKDTENSGAGEIANEILVFLGAEKKDEKFISPKLSQLSIEDCIHCDEQKEKERLDSYRNLLQISLDEPVSELQEFREYLETFDLTTEWRKARNVCFEFMGDLDAQIFSYKGEEKFKIRVLDENDKMMIINLSQTDKLSTPVKTCLMAQGFAHLKLDHPRYQQYIREINVTINKQVDKVVGYIESIIKGSGDFLRAPLFFVIRQLKQGKLRRVILEKILANIESLKQYPILVDMIKDLFKLVLLEERAAREFILGFDYSADRVAYAVSKDLASSTYAIIYDSLDNISKSEITQEEIAEFLREKNIKNRILQLWQFAIEVELRK